MNSQTISFLVAIPIVLVVGYFRIRRMTQARALKVERMWIVPLIFAAIITLAIATQPPEPDPVIYVSLVGVFVAGIALGWFRGRMVRIAVDMETHALTSQQSPWGMLIFLVILVVRTSARYLLASFGSELHLPVAAITDGLLLIYGGMIVGMRIEMWLRARKLLTEAEAARAAGKTVPAEVSEDHA